MNYIVFDLEWNQPMPHADTDPALLASLPFEVIEIGAVRVNERFEIEETFYGRIRPHHYRRINPFIAKVTKQKTADLKQGDPFEEVEARFRSFCGEDPVFLSWSPSDPYVWLQNVRHFTPEDAVPLQAIDLQMFFQMKIEPDMLGQQRSLENTLDLLQLEKPDDFHSALTDAEGTAAVLLYLAGKQLTHDLLDYTAEITDLAKADHRYDPQSPGSLKPFLEKLVTVCPHGDAPLMLSPVKKSNRFQATRMSACPRHGIIRETASRSDVSDEIRFSQKFLFVGAGFLPLKTKRRPPAVSTNTENEAEETTSEL